MSYDNLAIIEALAKIAEAVEEVNINFDAQTILDALKTVDGAGSGLNADMVDGLHASAFVENQPSDSISITLSPGRAFAIYNTDDEVLFRVTDDGRTMVRNDFRVVNRIHYDEGVELTNDIFSARNTGVRWNKNLPVKFGEVLYDREYSSRTIYGANQDKPILTIPSLGIVRVSISATVDDYGDICHYNSEYVCYRNIVRQLWSDASSCFYAIVEEYPTVYFLDNVLAWKWLVEDYTASIRIRCTLL